MFTNRYSTTRFAPDAPDGGNTPATNTGTPNPGTSGTPATGGVDAKTVEALKQELEQAKAKVAEHEEVWKHTQNVLVKGASPESQESLRVVLKRAGYSTGEIEAIVAGEATTETPPANPPAPKGKGKTPKTGDEGEGAEDERDLYIKQLEQRVKGVEADTAERRRQDLENKLNAEINQVLEKDQDLKTLIAKSQKPEVVRDMILQEMRDQAKAGLRKYAESTGGRLDVQKFGFYAGESAKAVGNKYRSVIGNPQHLGRTPETDSGVDEFLQSKPVELGKGRTGGGGRSEVTAYINDQLTRSLLSGTSEESRL